MNLHERFAYLKYRLKAKGRHGTHSPFIYRLTEDVLKPPLSEILTSLTFPPSMKFLSKVQWELLARLLDYFQPARLCICAENDAVVAPLANLAQETAEAVYISRDPGAYDAAIIICGPDKWEEAISGIRVNSQGFILIMNIHHSAGHEKMWSAVKEIDEVNASADLFYAGLLLFDNSFFEKQEFTIRFPL